MPVYTFTVSGLVTVPEGVSTDDINILVTPVIGEKEEKVPEENWDVNEVEIEEVF